MSRRVHLSVGVFPDGKVGYSIGKDIQKRSFPQSNGSSSKGGALNDGKASSNPILAQSDAKSNTFYQTSENNSETEKTAMQIALEKAGITNQYMQDGGKDATGSNRSYSLSENARRDVHNALNDKKFQGDIKLTDTSPSIILSHKGVKNLPMLMNTSHIRENIFTEDEARNKGLKVNENINYHGLGEDLFLKVIEDLDNVTEAYRGTKNADNPARRENYFLLISKQTDKDGNTINIPVFINEKGRYNRVFVDTNKIATVFGRSELDKYIREQINAKNLVRIKNRSNQTSEWTSPINARYGMNTSNDIIFNKDDSVNRSFSLKNSSV